MVTLKDEEEYQTALGMVEELWSAEEDTPDYDLCNDLIDQVMEYEADMIRGNNENN